jgi:hypothetical protein
MTYATFSFSHHISGDIGLRFGLPFVFWPRHDRLCTLIGIVTMLRFRLSGYSFSLFWSLIEFSSGIPRRMVSAADTQASS